MNLKTIIRDKNERGQGVFYKASQELDKKCEVTFGLYLPQCEVSDVRITSVSSISVITPKYIEYIEQNPNKVIGIMVDAEAEGDDNTRSLRLMNEMIAGVAELNHKNIYISVVIGL